MTARRITPQTTLDTLKKEAKRFLKLLRAHDQKARQLLLQAWPDAPAQPVLRDVQHAIAREYGFANWKSLKEALERQAEAPLQLHDRDASVLSRFFEFACPDHHVRGRPAHRMAEHAAMRLLQQHPELPRENFYTAIVCGELDIVERVLRENPQAASLQSGPSTPDRTGAGGSDDLFHDIGPKGWAPLSYLCFTRLPLTKTNDNAVAIARLLLDHGADPNVFFMAGDSRYTPLTGVIGEGEEDRPPHPRRDELTRLLLERGAEPYDGQVIYNIHFHGKVLWYLKLMYEFSLKAGREKDWRDPEWHMLDQGGYGSGARWHLRTAIEHNDLELAEWCLAHGANPNAPAERSQHFSPKSLYEQAVLRGEIELAELLARYGATRVEPAPDSEDAFFAACFRRDRATADALLKEHPEYLQSHVALHKAAEQNRAEVIEFLLDLGVPANVEHPHNQSTALHAAAYRGSAEAVDVLIRRGAKIDPVDSMHDATPLWWAMWSQRERVVTMLARYSRDVWALNFTGHLERVREVLAAEPRFATMSGESTPLFWLPDDEQKAVATVELFLSLGADASFRRKSDGLTAADVARRRGLDAAADLLAAAEHKPAATPAIPKSPEVDKYHALAGDMVKAYATGDENAMQGIKEHFGRSFNVEDVRAIVWRTTYKVRQASGSAEAFQLAEAQELIARSSGFPNWPALIEGVATGKGAPGPPHAIDPKDNRLHLRRIPTPKDWDTILGVMKEHRIPSLEAQMMTDEALDRISRLGFVTHLSLGGSRGMSDDGMQYLARMPQLKSLNLSEYPGGKLTDRGLEVLRHLPNLKRFEMCWQKGITDKGVANLKYCENLENVNLMGSPTGDGVIAALRGKPKLRHFSTGRLVTDLGLPMLHEYPLFKTWHGGGPDHPQGAEDAPTKLLVDGPFTDNGLAGLSGLQGVYHFDLFWHVTNLTGDAFRHLVAMPNLASLGCDGRLATDLSFRHIAAIPHLRVLRAQEAEATDDGWAALSASQTLERIWGRECPNFGNRGFIALSKMPKLRGFGIGCQRVDDAVLSILPQFPSLREITPIGFQDSAFRHIGKCEKLEKLTCMYCRETGDAATEHIAGLHLKSYYAGLTQITDRSLEILGRMGSLEVIELFETKSVTNAGLAHLAKLPNLQRVELSGLPNVTLSGTKAFPATVQVNWDV